MLSLYKLLVILASVTAVEAQVPIGSATATYTTTRSRGVATLTATATRSRAGSLSATDTSTRSRVAASVTPTATRTRGVATLTATATRSHAGSLSATDTATRSHAGSVSATDTATRSRMAASVTATVTRSRVAGSVSATDTATRSRGGASISGTDTRSRTGSVTMTNTATRSRAGGSTSATITRSPILGSVSATDSRSHTASITITDTPTGSRAFISLSGTNTPSGTWTPTATQRVGASNSGIATQTATSSPLINSFTMTIPSPQTANADTLIRGYLGSYAATAGYSNMMIQSITWMNGAYTVTGLSSSASQFAAGFPLSTSYTNLIANLNPSSSPSPGPSASALNLGLIVGVAGGGVAVLIAAVVAVLVYRRKQKARRPVSVQHGSVDVFAPSLPLTPSGSPSMTTLTKMFVPSSALHQTPPTNFNLAHLQENEDYYDPEQAVTKPRTMLRNEFIPTFQRQASHLTMVKTHLNSPSLAPSEFPPQHALGSAQLSRGNRPLPTLGRQGDVQRAIHVKSLNNPFNKSNKMFVTSPHADSSSLALPAVGENGLILSESSSAESPQPPPPFPQG